MAIVYPRTTHREAHFTGSATVRDVVIGMSDGLTVPFALAAGLSGAVNSSFVVLVAGVAEMAAGSMAMGLGGYLAARSEADSYRSELAREHAEVRDVPEVEAQEVRDIFRRYGLEGSGLESAVQAVRSSPEGWVRFMMREELGLEEPDPKRAPRSAYHRPVLYRGRAAAARAVRPGTVVDDGLPVEHRRDAARATRLRRCQSSLHRCPDAARCGPNGRGWRSSRGRGVRVSTPGQPVRRVRPGSRPNLSERTRRTLASQGGKVSQQDPRTGSPLGSRYIRAPG